MRINHNLPALNTYGRLSFNNNAVSKSLEKLSSGFRINKAGDDAAGLAISEKMRGQIRGLNQAVRNSQDGISLIQTAEGAASSVHSMLQRGRELAVQAANGTLANSDRQALNDELTQIKEQIDDVADYTEFNTIKLLNEGSDSGISQSVIDQLKTNVPYWIDDALDAIQSKLGIALPGSVRNMEVVFYFNDAETRAAYTSTNDGGASLTLGLNLSKLLDSNKQIPAGSSGGGFDTVIAHEIVHALQYTQMSDLLSGGLSNDELLFMEGMATAVQGGIPLLSGLANNSDALLTDPWNSDYASVYAAVMTLHEITDGGLQAVIDQLETGVSLDAAINNTTQTNQGEFGAWTPTDFTDFAGFMAWFNTSAEVNNYLNTSNDFNSGVSGVGSIANGEGTVATDDMDDAIVNNLVMDHPGIYNVSFNDAAISQSKKLIFQIGANQDQSIEFSTANISTEGISIQNIDISDRTKASQAIDTLDGAIQKVSAVRSRFGAIQNRLEHTISNLMNAGENLTAAESRVRDVDMAKEMMEFTKGNILSQAAQAMLAQANQQPRSVLELLS